MNDLPNEASPPHTDLHRGLGVIGIVFMVVAAAAPITVVAANFPIIISVSGSLGAPLMILVATAILLLFSVGFSWMTPHVPDAGAFYSYIDRGLGRRAGLQAAHHKRKWKGRGGHVAASGELLDHYADLLGTSGYAYPFLVDLLYIGDELMTYAPPDEVQSEIAEQSIRGFMKRW